MWVGCGLWFVNDCWSWKMVGCEIYVVIVVICKCKWYFSIKYKNNNGFCDFIVVF